MISIMLNDGEGFHIFNKKFRNGLAGFDSFGSSFTKLPENIVVSYCDYKKEVISQPEFGFGKVKAIDISCMDKDEDLVKEFVNLKISKICDKILENGASDICFVHWGRGRGYTYPCDDYFVHFVEGFFFGVK